MEHRKPCGVIGCGSCDDICRNLHETTSTIEDATAMKRLTIYELKKAASKIMVGSSGKGKNKRWFERLMNWPR
jgi:Fe-S-cluster-containing hydrogenase component 2